MLIPAITEGKRNQLDRNILALPVGLGGLGLENPSLEARCEYASSVKVSKTLVEKLYLSHISYLKIPSQN